MINIVHSLRMAKGTKAKLDILKQHADNENWLKVLKYMYDTGNNYYISSISDNTFKDDDIDCNAMFFVLEQLISGEMRGNKARKIANAASKEYGEIFRLIIQGSLNAGVSTTTINKAYPGLIPTYPLMLAENETVKEFPVWGSTKYDGVRLLARVEDGKVTLRTRAGKILHLSSLIKSMESLPNGVYDGELIKGSGLQISRTKITGDVNKVLKGSMDDIANYSFMVFDHLTLAEWDSKTCDRPLSTRLRGLIQIDSSIRYIKIVEQKELLSQSDIDEMFKDRLANGFEGLILRYPHHPYEWKRTKNLIKNKAIHSCVLRCVDVIEGKGKYEGMIGALVCVGKVDGKEVGVKVGTGLDDFARDRPSSDYIDHDIDIEYNDIVKSDNNDYYSLFLPVFKRIVGKLDT